MKTHHVRGAVLQLGSLHGQLHQVASCLRRAGATTSEIVIVDDGSTKDDTAEKADAWQAEYPDDRSWPSTSRTAGTAQAVNTGLAHAEGRYYQGRRLRRLAGRRRPMREVLR